jgi:long-chain acyl-CoA synthetase
VVGDSRSGWTPAFNVLYWPLRAFSRGAYPAIPARRSSPVDVVPVDYVADAILELAGRPETTYHLTAGSAASSVGELIDLAGAYLDRRVPVVVPPALYRGAVHPLLTRTGSEARRRALRRSEVFFPYFAMRGRYDDALAREALGNEPPPLHTYFDRLMAFALEANWGRRPLSRPNRSSREPRQFGQAASRALWSAPRRAETRARKTRPRRRKGAPPLWPFQRPLP